MLDRFLEVQHQLNMAEKVNSYPSWKTFFVICDIIKELEKKFSETGAYKNLKKMLGSKNATIKEMREKLNVYEPNTIEDDEREEE
jgi:hypothetical protein